MRPAPVGQDWPLRFGAFLPPVHDPAHNPTRALRRDVELIAELDALGYDEAWIGEHHSGGHEIVASPEVVIAHAAAYAPRIRLGTGVSSLPYHHPLLLADRMVLLDHLTGGRVMLGCGPGALASDAHMLGIDPLRQRTMMEEALEAIVALLRSDAPVTRTTDWFTMRDARLQLRPMSPDGLELAVAAQVSPSGARAAGRFGIGLLSMGATTTQGFDALARHWRVMEERAAEFGTTVDRRRWRLVGPMHLADTVDEARRDVDHGLASWLDYFQRVAALPIAAGVDPEGDLVDGMNATGLAVIGTPEMAVAQLTRLIEQSGGFGTYLLVTHDWANWEATLRSYRLFVEEVVPRFRAGLTGGLEASRAWTAANRPAFLGQRTAAVEAASGVTGSPAR